MCKTTKSKGTNSSCGADSAVDDDTHSVMSAMSTHNPSGSGEFNWVFAVFLWPIYIPYYLLTTVLNSDGNSSESSFNWILAFFFWPVYIPYWIYTVVMYPTDSDSDSDSDDSISENDDHDVHQDDSSDDEGEVVCGCD